MYFVQKIKALLSDLICYVLHKNSPLIVLILMNIHNFMFNYIKFYSIEVEIILLPPKN